MRSKPLLPPPKVARLLDAVRATLSRLGRASAPAPVAALDVVMAGWFSQAVCAAAELGIADSLGAARRSAKELAAELQCDEDALRRLLRLLASHGFFRERAGRYENTPLSATLRRDDPQSIRAFALYVGSARHREHWSELARSVRTGTPSIEALRGSSFFEYAARERAFGPHFNAAMTALSELAREALLSRYDFDRFTTVVDVGGGEGRLLAEVLRRTPRARGVLFDLPAVVESAPALLRAAGVAERTTIATGSFLDAVPEEGDLYLLKHILHDWGDEQARAILVNIRKAMQRGSTLLVFESVVPETEEPHLAKLTDLEMLLCLGGRERTQREFARLFEDAGFELTRAIETAAPISILEARAR